MLLEITDRIQAFSFEKMVDLSVNRYGAATPADLFGPRGAGRRDRDEASATHAAGEGLGMGQTHATRTNPPRSGSSSIVVRSLIYRSSVGEHDDFAVGALG